MSAVSDDYLVYPHRAYGMDQALYPWRPAPARAPGSWPQAKALAASVIVLIEHHSLTPRGRPFKHPGAMQTPYPDLRHYTTRDYGNRVGVYRILDALKAAGLQATFPVNACILARYPALIEAIAADGHEIAAYGVSTDDIHWSGLEAGEEERLVAETRAAFEQAGLAPRAWMSPARQQSFETPHLIRAAGFDICLDWEQDSAPVMMATRTGGLWALPVMNELDDRKLLIDQRQSEEDWARQILTARDTLIEEASRSGRQTLAFTLTPYVIGQPFRIAALRQVFAGLSAHDAVWATTASRMIEALA